MRNNTSGAGVSFCGKVPSRFNQLLVFDDRIIQGVRSLQGTMGPPCCPVLHGHLNSMPSTTSRLTLPILVGT